MKTVLPVEDHPMDCYVALPAGDDKCPAVIILSAVFGVDPNIQRVAELVAEVGYIGFAPNIFHRTHPDYLEHSEEFLPIALDAGRKATMDGIAADLGASIDYLLKHPRCDGSIGAWGFCYGGAIAYLLATYPQIKASVSFYAGQIAKQSAPHRPPMINFTKDIIAPLFLVFGGQDQNIPAENIEVIKKALEEHHKRYKLEIYPDEGHGFFHNDITKEWTIGARDAWPKVQQFLKENLRASVPV